MSHQSGLKTMQTAYISHPHCLKHEMGEEHPECPYRIRVIEDMLIADGVMDQLQRYEAPEVTMEQLLRAHYKSLIDSIALPVPENELRYIGGDTAQNSCTYQAALRAAGAVILGVDLVVDGKVDNVFCNIRPPGHHASRTEASGFCFFNNVAIGALHALEHHGIKRVAIADFDVHHGNGTESIFHDDSRVMLCSTFQHPYYPYCGVDSGNDHIINVPLTAGSWGAAFRSAVMQHWLPALERFQPELILISAGFDAHRDGMSGINLMESDYEWVTMELKRFAEGRIVSALEGGYELASLARSALAHIKVLNYAGMERT